MEEEMEQTARDEILQKLRAAPKQALIPRPAPPPLRELSLTLEEMIDKFTERLVEETGVVYRVQNNEEALEKLTEIVRAEGLKKVMASTDDVVSALNLKAWGGKNDVQVMNPQDFSDRESFRDAVFDEAQAGITGADFAVAETGTLGLMHNADRARLVSLAPILHIAVVPVQRMIPVYERLVDPVFGNPQTFPSQFVFITGPSMSADIQSVLFKGMHGPRKVIVILIG
jgi:L-lactate dehydrogenase complex protein LldG